MKRQLNRPTQTGGGFTVLELLVVLGIVAICVGFLLPAMANARRRGKSLQCQANLRVLGQMLMSYQNESGGWPFPVGVHRKTGKPYASFGINVPPHERWPMKVFKIPAAPLPPKYDSEMY